MAPFEQNLSNIVANFHMVDVHTKKQRSYNMSRIKSKWTSQEIKIHGCLKGKKVKHKMHPKAFGNPDIGFPNSHVLIFLDGCFWHGCPKCYSQPKSNKKFWAAKIKRNRTNDKRVTNKLRKAGFTVLRFWECEVRNNSGKVLNKIFLAVKKGNRFSTQ